MAGVYADMALRHGGAGFRAMLATYTRDTSATQAACHGDAPLPAEVQVGVAQLAHLLGAMSVDSGYPALAQDYFVIAVRLADEAHHPSLSAITLRELSAQALDHGFGPLGLQLAERSWQRAIQSECATIRSFVLVQRGHAHAMNGDRSQALRDLRAAEAHHDGASQRHGPFRSYPQAGLLYRRGQILEALGEPRAAIEAWQSALSSRDPSHRRQLGLTRARLAEVCLRSRRMDAACAHWSNFLDHYPYVRSDRMDRALAVMRTQLGHHRLVPEVAELLSRARILSGLRRKSFGG
ncbi:tetratricopeptide repeat protein [Streptomyces sp. H27-G5]|uniref:tetratricopeptide repeat protein n=1 Tax=Streptomyces sp. H27-G5 TaxID=2996698 RepID=UPI00227129AA|nr:tetratricopeptide repeat protein [Streptomyces sp. H27-G5]MCY0924462.1 tetratricopeptide repeat protein [Streptomyces sp. H27-G5]